VKPKRLSKVAKELNVGIATVVEFLAEYDIEIEAKPNTKIPEEGYKILLKEYATKEDISNYEEESQRTLTFNNEEEDTLEEVTEEADEIFIKDINESLSEEVNAVTGEKPPTIEEKVEKEKIVEEKEKEESSVAAYSLSNIL